MLLIFSSLWKLHILLQGKKNHYFLMKINIYLKTLIQGKEEVWSNERFQRNAISRGINCVKDLSDLSDHDFIIISDVDEIPDPNTLDVIRKRDNRIEDIYSLEMDFYYYNLNTKLQEKWYFSKIIPYKKYKDLNKPCEKLRHTSCITIPNGGWHLSYFGDKYFIQNKIMNFSHQELNHDKFTSLSKIEERVQKGSDLFDRHNVIKNIEIKDNHYLPIGYEKYLHKYFVRCAAHRA